MEISPLSYLERVARLLWMAVARSSCVILRLCRSWRTLLPTSTSILDIDFPPGKDGKQKTSYREVYWIWMGMSILIQAERVEKRGWDKCWYTSSFVKIAKIIKLGQNF